MRQRLPLVISLVALATALLADTPVGTAVGATVKRALFAKNSGAVGGIKASRRPSPGRLLPLGADARFPSSVIPPGGRGPQGPQGPEGPQGPRGEPGADAVAPAGAVMFFNLVACPSGWIELTAARGRYLVGLPSGGDLAETVGTALTNVENRPVGQHDHGITDPGHSHLYDKPVLSSTGSGGSQAGVLINQQTGASVTKITINPAGAVAGTNAPYLQLLACQKT